MSDFRIVSNRSETQLGDNWFDSPKYLNKKIEVDERGNKVAVGYEGRHYKLIVKERKFSGLELFGRRLLGVALTAVSFGALLLNKDVKNLFVKKVERVRFGILVPKEKEEVKKTKENKEQKEIAAPTSSTAPIAKTTEKENYQTVPLNSINYQSGGYIGEPQFWDLFPDYLNKLTLENGDPLPLNPDDICVEFGFNDEAFLGLDTIYLPLELFKGKNTGDTVRLRYEGKLIEFSIKIDKFDQLLKLAETYQKVGERKLAFNTDPYWFRKLDCKVFQFVKDDTGNITLKENESIHPFADFKMPQYMAVDLLYSKPELVLAMNAPNTENLQFVLNKEYLILYFNDKNKEEWRTISLRDDRLKEFSFSQMLEKLKNAKITLRYGQIQILLPKIEQ